MNKIKIWNDLLKLPIDEIKKITLELRLIEIVRMLDQDKYLKLKERWTD